MTGHDGSRGAHWHPATRARISGAERVCASNRAALQAEAGPREQGPRAASGMGLLRPGMGAAVAMLDA
jgi:hypothetical protein